MTIRVRSPLAASPKLLVLNPQAAKLLSDAGWTKAKFTELLAARCVRPVRDVKRTGGLSLTYKTHWTKVADASDDDALVPAVVGPHGLQILVSGGWGSASSQCIWLNSVHGEMVTRKIDWAWE